MLKMSFHGSRMDFNKFMMDGTSINSSAGKGIGGASEQAMGVETIKEFQVITSSDSGDFGRAGGGVISGVTTSGTNEFHGSVFECSRNSALLLFALFVFLFCQITIAAQEQEGVDSARIVVGSDKTGPGGDAFVPIVFSSSTTESVGSVIVEIRFPENDLVFQEIRNADSAKTNLSASAEKDPNEPGKTVLRVGVESKAGPLASGIVGILIFKVSDSVTFGEKIPLPQVGQALSDGPSPRSVELATVDGQIDVSAVPGVFSCFFYMH